jgi:hypothetical protein
MGVLEAVDTAFAAHKGPRAPLQGRSNGPHLSRHGREDVWLHDAHVDLDPLLLPGLGEALKKKRLMVPSRPSCWSLAPSGPSSTPIRKQEP